jgi:cytochrome P450
LHNFRFRRVIGTLDRCVAKWVQRRRELGCDADDALSVLVREGGGEVGDREIRDDLMSLFVAGNEATATALFWCTYHLARDAELADRLAHEVRSTLGDRDANADDVSRIRLATDIFRESMRMYPAAHIILRRSTRDLELGGVRVPGGILVMINGFMIQRDKNVFREPEVFRPERFQSMTEKDLAFSYLPFGAGPRTCIGNHFAMLQGPLSLLSICRQVRFEPVSPEPAQLATGFAIGPKGGYPVRVRRLEFGS